MNRWSASYHSFALCTFWLLLTNICRLTLAHGAEDVSIRFNSSDYGFLNETFNSYVTFVVERIGPSSSAFSVIIELDPSQGRVDDFQFHKQSWTVHFRPSLRQREWQSTNIFVKNDNIPEDDEVYRFRLRVPNEGLPVTITEPSTTRVTIPANDDANGIISIGSVSPLIVEEHAGSNVSVLLPLIRRRGSFGNVTVQFEIEPTTKSEIGKSGDVDDLFPLSGQIVIEDGAGSGFLQIFIVHDDSAQPGSGWRVEKTSRKMNLRRLVPGWKVEKASRNIILTIPEDDEAFRITLVSTDRGTLEEGRNSIELVIEANDSPLRFLQSFIKVEEEDNHANVVTVEVLRGLDETGKKRIGPDSQEVFVSYQVLPGTATPKFDYNVAEYGTLRFGSGVHNTTVEIFIVPDSEAEVAENFTIELLHRTVVGDAVVTTPDVCVITIKTNDEANGVLAIDFSTAVASESDKEEKIFIIDEDDSQELASLGILRKGGSFETVSIEWSLSTSSNETSVILPTSGTVTFLSGQTENYINFNVTSDDTPNEAAGFVFKLLGDTIKGGARLDEENKARLFISDSNDVYGIINIQRGSKILFDHETNIREIHLTIKRSGGTVGRINVTYSASFLPPDAVDVRDAMPGILVEPNGVITIEGGDVEAELKLEIKESAFLHTDSSFSVILKSVVLDDRKPLVPPKTPRLGTRSSTTIQVTEEYASSEIGFTEPMELQFEEPLNKDGPMEIGLEVTREGIWSEVTLDISYRSDVEPFETTRGIDYKPGPAQVTLASGQKSVEVIVTILPDDVPETDEVLIVRIDGVTPDDQKLRKNFVEKKILIKENDSPGGIFQFESATNRFIPIKEEETETIAMTIFRSEGDLATRMVEYDVHPNGSAQFYGIPEIVVFQPGERIVNISFVPKDDDTPELAQNFTLELKSYGSPKSALGEFTSVTIGMGASDDPHGVFVMAEKNDEQGIPGRVQNILESTDSRNYSCFYVVHRQEGVYGNVTVNWKIIPNDTNDVFPAGGTLDFPEGISEGVINLWSLRDDIPESMEEFSIVLHSPSGGSRVGRPNNASFVIDANDKAIFFEGPESIDIVEGRELVLHVRREGSGSDTTSVKYRTRPRNKNDTQSQKNADGYAMVAASPLDDYVNVTSTSEVTDHGLATFPPTSLREVVKIQILEDDIPEDDEEFFVEIVNATADYVVYGNTNIQVRIAHNDNSSGVFSFNSPHSLSLQEGISYNLSINRDYGAFRNVEIHWNIISSHAFESYNSSAIFEADVEEANDFLHSEGIVVFAPGEESQTFSILAVKDNIPEYKENFVLILTNTSGGSAKLHPDSSLLRVNLSVALNDYPYGRLKVSEASRNVSISEDFDNQENVGVVEIPPTHVDIVVVRTMGFDGTIMALWELHESGYFMPECRDILFRANLTSIDISITSTRGTGTPVYVFQQGPSALLDFEELHISLNYSSGFSISLWIRPQLEDMFAKMQESDGSDNMDLLVPLFAKSDRNGDIEFQMGLSIYGRSVKDMHQIELYITYWDSDGIAHESFVQMDNVLEDFKNLSEWKHIVFSFQDYGVSIFVNGERAASENELLVLETLSEKGVISLGHASDSDATFLGLIQDYRVYSRSLDLIQINKIYRMPAQSDVTPVSGILVYQQNEVEKVVTIHTIDDAETESNENFNLVLLDVTNGAAIGEDNNATITVLKNDNANGLFGFAKPCRPEIIVEGTSTICYIKRTHGMVGTVTINWKIRPVVATNDEDQDFVNNHGTVVFKDAQPEATFRVEARDDQLPEIAENHEIVLEFAESHDGIISSSLSSGASIDEDSASTLVRIMKGDNAHGIFQFSFGPPPSAPEKNQSSVRNEPLIVHVEEEQAVVNLLIVRAAGWHGDASVEWRCRDGTAISTKTPRDFVSAAGTLNFRDGEGFQFINITILDDDEPELEKSFFVDLLTPTGGAALNEASHAEIIINPSDNAFGVYQFSQESLSVIVSEPNEGLNSTKLSVKRSGGNLGETTLKWKVKSDPDGDLDQTDGEVVFSFGQSSAEIELSVTADDEPEFDEHFIVELTQVSHGVLGGTGSLVALLTVPANDDPYGIVTFKPEVVIVEEGSENATLTVRRTGGTAGSIRVHYKTLDMDLEDTALRGVAAQDLDFTAQDSSFLIGENSTIGTFTIPILDDEIPETDEDFFVQLTHVELMPSGAVPDSPRLGPPGQTMIRVVINENDHPNGVVELSTSSVFVDEEWSDNDKSVMEIIRKFGTFGEVTVGVSATRGDALPDEDFSLTSSKVTFLEGEDRKRFPVKIINDFAPEFEENFTVHLMPELVTGGVQVGDDATCRIVIAKSDFPYGSLEISVSQSVVSEPADGSLGVPVEFTVKRQGGLSGVVAVEWKAFVETKQEDSSELLSSDYDGSSSGIERVHDIDISSGVLNLVSNQDETRFTIKVMPDNIPEDDEIVNIKLMRILPTYRGVINRDKDTASIRIPANDFPYGTVSLERTAYNIEELESMNNDIKVKIIRGSGLFGTLRVVYSTEEIDLISEALARREDIVGGYFEMPVSIPPQVTLQRKHGVDLTSRPEPLKTCAEVCMRQKACMGFVYSDITIECAWIRSSAFPVNTGEYEPSTGRDLNERILNSPAARFRYFMKVKEKADMLYDSQARSGMDFEPIIGASLLLHDGQDSGEITVKILSDTIPELDEFFKIRILNVSIINVESSAINHPVVAGNGDAMVTIKENDYPYGLFTMHSSSAGTRDNGRIVEAEERPQLSLEMVVERKGGSVGEVTVDWHVQSGEALRNVDFVGDDATLKFAHGETRKVISLSVIDDDIPELNEDFHVELGDATGGAVVSQTDGRVHVIILANDNVGGIVSFHPQSTAVIGDEGNTVRLDLIRSKSAEGSCSVSWIVEGVNSSDGVNATDGITHFKLGSTSASIWVLLLADDNPEIKEEYSVKLEKVQSFGIPSTGSADLDPHRSLARITIRGSDEPHGVFRFSETSLITGSSESSGLEIIILRGFGAVGKVKAFFQIIPGALGSLNPDIEAAEPFVDFTFESDGVENGRHYMLFEDGVTSRSIVFTVIDDDIPELNEIFHVNLTEAVIIEKSPEAINFIPPSIDPLHSLSQIVIDANDGTKGMIQFHQHSVNFTTNEVEGRNIDIALTIIREKGTYGDVTFFIYPQNGEAELGSDYECEATTMTIRDSQDEVDYIISVTDDDIPEGEESFEVIIGNPSAGLELGNETKSTIYILSNDDAHGRLSFTNDPVIYIKEPSDESVSDSKAELAVTRNPPDGTFGDISVRYFIEREGSRLDSVSADLHPEDGYITIKNGVQQEVLEISAVADDEAELDESFLVTLSYPQGGATLSENITTKIIIKKNDAPYGRFKIQPKTTKTTETFDQIEEGPGVKIMDFDITRTQGSLGNVLLAVKSKNGTAHSLSTNSTGTSMLCALQTFDASTMTSFITFNYADNFYLLSLSSDRSGPMSTKLGSSGTLKSLTPGIHSTLFQYKGLFTPVQTIETDGAAAALTFDSGGGRRYFLVANRGRFGRYETTSRLYKVLQGGKLRLVDEVATKGASDAAYFQSTGIHYIVIANSIDNNQISNINSHVYRFDTMKEKLVLIQTLPTRGAAAVDTFNWNGDIYLAIANGRDSELEDDVVRAVIYKWTFSPEGIPSFAERQEIDASHATAVKIIDIENDIFVAFSSMDFIGGKVTSQGIQRVDIFKVVPGQRQNSISLQRHQNINVSHVENIHVTKIPATSLNNLHQFKKMKGKAHILAVSSSVQSKLLLFNPETTKFEPFSSAGATKSMYAMAAKNFTMIAAAVDKTSTDETPVKSNFLNTVVKSGIYHLADLHFDENSGNGDFIPIMENLVLEFESGQSSHSVALSFLDDKFPENEEYLEVFLDNSADPRGDVDKEHGSVEVRILSNDDGHGVVGFSEDSMKKMVEETENDHIFTLTLIRKISTFGEITIAWEADGNLADISPLEGQVTFGNMQSRAGIQITVLSDDIPEVEEIVRIILTEVVHGGSKRPHLGARIDSTSSVAAMHILPNDSPHGIVRWSAPSLRSVIKEPETLSGASQLVTLEILRHQGQLGDIRVSYKTAIASNLPEKFQAIPGADFIARDDSIYMLENITTATIAISIVPDDVPEDIESFNVVLTEVALIGEPMMDSKPGIGPPGAETAEIIIDENDHARGFIQFNVTRNSKDAVEAFEMPGTNISLKLPLVRLVGAFRTVAVEWLAKPITASSRDFHPHSGTVHFEEGQRNSNIEIFVIDDDDVEFVETFTVQLVGKPGGAKLGGDVAATINILPNDSPSGMFGFVETQKSVKESNSPNDPDGKVELEIRRYQGSGDDVIVSWSLDESALSDLTPISGKLHFYAGERKKTIVLRSLPDQTLEGAETYSVKLVSATGGAEISPIAGTAEVTIEANHGAAGTVSIDPSTRDILTSEPTFDYDGLSYIVLHRGPGHFGDCIVKWQITPADANTFYRTEGKARFGNLNNKTEIILQIVDDEIPEKPQEFMLHLLTASDGGEIDQSSSSVKITVAASDSPHGTFSFSQPSYYVLEGGGNVIPGSSITNPTSTTLPTVASRVTGATSKITSAVASLTLLRNKGHMEEVSVTIVTNNGTATENEDYYRIAKRLVFGDGESFKIIEIELLDDNIPEGPEDFFVKITDVSLMSYSTRDFMRRLPYNVSLDIPPTIGDSSFAKVVITKNDGAEGIIQFPSETEEIVVDENEGKVVIEIVRVSGRYGEVGVTAKTIDKTAERNVDYLMPNAGVGVIFEDGQAVAYLTIQLVNDNRMEMAESFSVVLSGVNGGAKLGEKIIMEVIIAKSDYPNGVIHFLESNDVVSIQNPIVETEGKKLSFVLERNGGNVGEVNGKWKLVRSEPYYGETSSTSPVSDDIKDPTSGYFHFSDGEGGQREILVTVLPTPEEEEVEEHFDLILMETDPAEISQTDGSVKIIVEKKGNPNGIIQFSGETDKFGAPTVLREPEAGTLQVVFPVVRNDGKLGEVKLKWAVEALNRAIGADAALDLTESEGEIIFRDGQSNAEVIVYVKADNIPELAENFEVKLVSVEGGADLDRSDTKRQFMIQANDDPHGVVSIHSSDQTITVLPDNSRVILINVTRQGGTFGRVSVAFTVEFNNPKGNALYLESDTGDVIISDGSTWEIASVSISPTVFLAVGDKFTIRLTAVVFIDRDVTIPPKLSDHIEASVSVPPEAGSPQVGFDPTVSLVYNITRNSCRMTLKRVGLYGDVTVRWVSGYPDNRRSSGFREGQTMPTSSSITMSNTQSEVNITLTLFPNSAETEAFAAHILKVDSINGEDGAVILENHEFTEIDPCGAVKFASFSQHVTVPEDSSEVSLTIQRLYGSQYDIDVVYSTSPITAVPGKDYFQVTNGRIRMLSGQQEAIISVKLIKDVLPETSKEFIVKITEVSEHMQLYKGLSPRILHEESISRVSIQESDDAHGVLKFKQKEILVSEQSNDGSNIVVVMVTIERTVGSFGTVSVIMSTIGGGEAWQDGYMRDTKSEGDKESKDKHRQDIKNYLMRQQGRKAAAIEDYEVRQINVTFKERQMEVQVPLVILDDDEPEPSESFFAFLHSPSGGAKLTAVNKNEAGSIMKITIPPNDFPNGNIGFLSRNGIVIYEDTLSRSVDLVVSRKAAFGNVTVKWKAVLDITQTREGSSNIEERINLDEQIQQTEGEVICQAGVTECVITITLKHDEIAEFEDWFLILLYEVSAGARIDGNRRFVNVTMAESDHPYGLFQFSLQSRLPVVSKGNRDVGLTVERLGGRKFGALVYFITRQLKSASNIAGTTLYPAMADIDFVKTNDHVEFKPGQVEAFISIPLHMETSSPNPLPQTFQVKLSDIEGDGELNVEYNTANVTIVGKENTKRVWRVYEALQQELNDAVVQSISTQLHALANEPMDSEQVDIFHGILQNIIQHGKQRRLPPHIHDTIYDLFCKLLDPYRTDAVMGYTKFGDTFEQFVFSLMTGMDCRADDSATTSFGKCTHAVLQSARWYPEVINGYKFVGKASQDFFQIPVDLLDVQSTGVGSPNPTCYDIAFIEYGSQVWYSLPGEKGAMSNKIFSVGIDGRTISNLITPVRYRVYTQDARISPKGAECVLWNEASQRWLSRTETCSVEYDTDNYVDCACHHMSVYAVRGPTDELAGYNEATYVSCFICAVAAAMTILGYHVCSKHTTFASRLMMHMLFANGMTQLFFVISTLASEDANVEGCATIGIFLHYFWVAQFSWIMVQAINIWKVMIMGSNTAEQMFTIYFLIGWGSPTMIVALHSIVMYAVGFTTLPQIYGDVHANGDLCFIMDAKAGLLSAVAPGCLAVMATCTIGLQLYQRDDSWKQYDDMFRGKFNKIEIPLLFWYFFLLTLSWLWGGLHLAYGQMWMLVLFILFNMVKGLYLLVVYGILHNQLVRPVKSYEGGEGAIPSTGYATSAAGSRVPSVSGDLLNRSTQSLVAGRGKDDLDWGRIGHQFSRSLPTRTRRDSLSRDDTTDFDDLVYALNEERMERPSTSREPMSTIYTSPRRKPVRPSRRLPEDFNEDDVGPTTSVSPRRSSASQINSYPIADTHL